MGLSGRVRTIAWIALAVVAAFALTAFIVVQRFQATARDSIMKAIRDRYHGDVQLGDLQITLFPTVHATAANLTVRLPDQKDPLIQSQHLTVDATFVGFFRSPRHIRKLKLDGLRIHVPPHHGGQATSAKNSFILDEVNADGAMLEMLPSDPSKDPLHFDIHQLTMRTVGPGQPMTFHAELNNPKPPGFIHSDGTFGPWNQDDPATTPLNGRYTFSNADLGSFKSISGTLSSSGTFKGELDRLDVHGTTDVPDFALTSVGHPEHLRTEFDATVDGTNGNTILHPVKALLGNSSFEVSGPIERSALEKGKEINLTARSSGTGLSDFLRLAVQDKQPPMRGNIKFDTAVRIPPGATSVISRLGLDGKFSLTHVKFTSEDVQSRIASLSHHAQGEPKDKDTADVTADFAGRFIMHNGTLTLPMLEFNVPGARVTMDGHYAVESGEIDFKGTAKLDATVSQMTTGVKHVLLKAVDPIFRRDGAGTVLPLRITGTRGSPSFKLDVGSVIKHSTE